MGKLFLDLTTMKHAGRENGKDIFHHESGHEIRVDSGKLSPKLRAELQAMSKAKGGKITKDPTQEHLLPGDAIPNAIEKRVIGGMHKKGFAEGGKATDMLRAKSSGPMNPKLAESHKEPQRFADGSPTPVSNNDIDYSKADYSKEDDYAAQRAANAYSPFYSVTDAADGTTPAAPSPTLPPSTDDAQQKVPDTVQVGEPPQPGDQDFTGPVQSPSDETNAAPPSGDSTKPIQNSNDPEGSFITGIGLKQKGLQEEAKAQEDLGAARSAAINDPNSGIAAQQRTLDSIQQSVQDENRDHAGFVNDIKNGYINPNHYLQSMSGGDRVATAIGILASGLGAGNAGQPNMAMQFLNQQIDRDIGAQQTNLGAKQNLLRANMEHYQNMRDALDKTRIQMQTINAMKIDDAAAKATSPMAKANLLQASGQLKMETAGQLQQFAMRRALMSPNSNASMNDVNSKIQALRYMGQEGMAKDLESKAVPGFGVAETPVPQAARDQLIQHKQLDSAVRDLQNFVQHNSTIIPGTAAYNVGAQKALALQSAVREGQLGTVYKAGEQPLLDKFINSNPAGMMKYLKTQPQLDELLGSNTRRMNVLQDSYKFHPFAAEQQQQQMQAARPAHPYEGKNVTGPHGEKAVIRNGIPVPRGQ